MTSHSISWATELIFQRHNKVNDSNKDSNRSLTYSIHAIWHLRRAADQLKTKGKSTVSQAWIPTSIASKTIRLRSSAFLNLQSISHLVLARIHHKRIHRIERKHISERRAIPNMKSPILPVESAVISRRRSEISMRVHCHLQTSIESSIQREVFRGRSPSRKSEFLTKQCARGRTGSLKQDLHLAQWPSKRNPWETTVM